MWLKDVLWHVQPFRFCPSSQFLCVLGYLRIRPWSSHNLAFLFINEQLFVSNAIHKRVELTILRFILYRRLLNAFHVESLYIGVILTPLLITQLR